MRNKKGFTLVELLAVILVLGLVLVIAVPSVNKYLKSSKQKAFDVQINTMVEAVEAYANTFRKVLPQNNGEEVRITLGQLKAEGLIKNDMTDPKTDKYFDDAIEFTIRKNGNNFIYEVDESTIITRNTKTNSPTIKLSGDIVEYYKVGDVFVESGYTAFSYAGEEITNVVSDASTLTLTTTGVFKVKYIATDNNGITTTAIRNIIVSAGTKYKDGAPLYFNPTTGLKCLPTDAVSTTGTKSGCMKWYVFLDSEGSNTVKLLLDHNTTATVAWNTDSTGTTSDTANAQLQLDAAGWKQTINGTSSSISARMITAQEINQIAPTITASDWNQNDKNTWYYLHTGTTTIYEGVVGSNKYAWVIDNTNGCNNYGCNNYSVGTSGYWTSSYSNDNLAWLVHSNGHMTTHDITSSEYYGIRPVITISKDVFKD